VFDRLQCGVDVADTIDSSRSPGGHRPALALVRDGRGTETASCAQLAERSTGLPRWLHDRGWAAASGSW
jgi:hypothetical protein